MQSDNFKQHRLERFSSKGWAARGAFALVLVTTLVAGCQTPQQQTTASDQPSVPPEEIAENTNQYVGQIVTVRSEPIEQISPSTFTIEDQQFFGSEPILVVNATGEPFVFPPDGTDVQVTGEVRNFVFEEVNTQYNLRLEQEAYVEYENQPALIAQSLTVAPEPGELTSNPEEYYNEPLAVTGEVAEVQGANAFTLSDQQLFGNDGLLVLRATSATDQPVIADGETVAVRGVLRPFIVEELERDYTFNWDTGIQEQLEAEYSNRPVLIAETIYPSAIPE